MNRARRIQDAPTAEASLQSRNLVGGIAIVIARQRVVLVRWISGWSEHPRSVHATSMSSGQEKEPTYTASQHNG